MKSTNTPLPTPIRSRLVRYAELIPCKTAFIDAKTPGSDKKENFCLIGGGVAENPNQHVHINIPHGFDIGGARQPKGCKNSHHSHDTEEVFFVHEGEWKFTWGHDGSDGEIVLHAGDTISIPTCAFRGFENVGGDDGFLYAVLGLNLDGSAGHVTWAPYVYDSAREHGLVLLDDGRLIDTSDGAPLPDDGTPAKPTSMDDITRFKHLTFSEMRACVAQSGDDLPTGGLSDDTVTEHAIIGAASDDETLSAGKMGWPHGFSVRRLTLGVGAKIAAHQRFEEEVLFVHAGVLEVALPDCTLTLQRGDLFTVPIEMIRSFANRQDSETIVLVVRRGNHPRAARFVAASNQS